MSTTNPAEWIKASRSTNEGNCVEMRRRGETVEIRDSKEHGDGSTIGVAPTTFAAWIEAAKASRLDHLI